MAVRGKWGQHLVSCWALIGLILCSFHHSHDYFAIQFGIGLSLLSLVIAWHFKNYLGWSFGALSTYILVRSFWVIGFLYSIPVALYPMNITIPADACAALVALLVVVTAFIEMPKNWLRGFQDAIPVYIIGNSFYVIRHWWIGSKLGNSNGYSGVIDYSGMDAVLIAASSGLVAPSVEDSDLTFWMKVFGLGVCITAIHLSKSAMGWIILGVVLTIRYRQYWLLFISVAGGYLSVGFKMFSSSMRFSAYKMIFLEFSEMPLLTQFFGTGIGTFKAYSGIIQKRNSFMMDETGHGFAWIHAHSDYPIQSIWEFGYVGTAFLAVVFIVAIKRVKDDALCSMLVGFMGAAIFDFPVRYFPTAILSAYALVEALRLKHNKE